LRANALLNSLFNDIRSRARFPTKIGEYLASGRPVINNSVGEITRFLEDGVNAAYLCPGDSKLYGDKILEALDNPERAKVNWKNKDVNVATIKFHYLFMGNYCMNSLNPTIPKK